MIQKNTVALMRHMMEARRKYFLESASMVPPVPFPGPLMPADKSGKGRMTESRIYVGLNDSKTRKQIYETEEYLRKLKEICKSSHTAFSVDIEEGGYFHEDGEYTEETSLVLVLIDTDRDTVQKIAKELCDSFHQESVLITEDYVEGYFVT